MKWFKVSRWGFEAPITEVEIIRETPQQIVYMGTYFGKAQERRANKAGEYFPSFDEAKAYLISQAERDLQNADDTRSRAIEAIKKYRALTPLALKGEQS